MEQFSPSTRRVPSGAPKQLRREAQSLETDDLAIAKAGFGFPSVLL
jgi:hypothetical protein